MSKCTSRSPLLFVEAFISDGTKPTIKLQKTRPVNGEFIAPTEVDVTDAQITLFQDGQPFVNFFFQSDTTKAYETVTDFLGHIDTTKILESVKNYYTTDTPLSLQKNALYHIEITANGYPRVISEDILFLDEIAIEDAQVDRLGYIAESTYLLSSVSFLLRKEGRATRQQSLFSIYPWYKSPELQEETRKLIRRSFGQNIPPLENAVIRVNYQNIYLHDVYDSSGLAFPHEGACVLVETLKEEALEYNEALLENSGYIGGFFPPNPYFPHNVQGGYGIFSIVERDSIRLY
ncbi:MAG: DUF4249 family protein [Saprospiraceae bacterium]